MTGRVIDELSGGESRNSAHHEREGDADGHMTHMEVLPFFELVIAERWAISNRHLTLERVSGS